MSTVKNSSQSQCGIGNVLRSLRIIQDLSVKELAEKMNLSSTYICDIEANRKKPSLDMLEKYSNALGVSRSTLLYFDDQGKKNNYNHRKLLLSILQELEKNLII